ncbi:uncharacterized protein [Medicago truncatula]|nr:uncharacterized protein LOC11412335 [Medicago truncatula]
MVMEETNNHMQLIEEEDMIMEEESIDKLISQDIDADDVKKLLDAGIFTCNSLLLQAKKNLTRINDLSEETVDKIWEAAEKHLRKSVVGIATGSQMPDELLESNITALRRHLKLISWPPHPNKIDELRAIESLFQKSPAELKPYSYILVETLRGLVNNEDGQLRNLAYDVFELVFPYLDVEDQQMLTRRMMGSILNAMQHSKLDIQSTSFEFLNHILWLNPTLLLSDAKKIFQNYKDFFGKILYFNKDQKTNLKVSLPGLIRCLSHLVKNDVENDLLDKGDIGERLLHAYEDDSFMSFNGLSRNMKDLIPLLVDSFQRLIPSATEWLDEPTFGCLTSILHCIDLIVIYLKKTKDLNSQSGPEVAASLENLFHHFPIHLVTNFLDKGSNDKFLELNFFISKIFLELKEWIFLNSLLEKCLEFVESALLGKFCQVSESANTVWERHLSQLIPFVSKLILHGANNNSNRASRLLPAFTHIFTVSMPGSLLKWTCLHAIKDMLSHIHESFPFQEKSECVKALDAWMLELTELLLKIGYNPTDYSLLVIQVLHGMGKVAVKDSLLRHSYDNIQYQLHDFFCILQEEGEPILYGPFLFLPKDTQELFLCCVEYFSWLDTPILDSLLCFCITLDIDPDMLFRIIEVLNSFNTATQMRIEDYVNFFITLVSKLNVYYGVVYIDLKNDAPQQTLKKLIDVICSNMTQKKGDNYLLVEKKTIKEILRKRSFHNAACLLRILVTMDSEPPSRLSGESIISLSYYVSEFLMQAVKRVREDEYEKYIHYDQIFPGFYFLEPCFSLFSQCPELLSNALKAMASTITYDALKTMTSGIGFYLVSEDDRKEMRNCLTRANVITSVIVLMSKDIRLKSMSVFKNEINYIIDEVHLLQSSQQVISFTDEERHAIQFILDQLRNISE